MGPKRVSQPPFHQMRKLILLLTLTLVSAQLSDGRADPNATPRTTALFEQLQEMTEAPSAAWGYQYGLFRGISQTGSAWTNLNNPLTYSDAKNITGAHPAITGWDFDEMRWSTDLQIQQAIAADAIGAITIFSFHIPNPVTGGRYNDTNLDSLQDVLPGGSHHEQLLAEWAFAADIIAAMVDAEGNPVPVIVRPYHEMSGRWFWWGAQHPVADYVALWRWTVEYLRDERGLHNILYAYSPDKTTAANFLNWWPGDDYVDLIGLDYYRTSPGGNAAFAANVQVLIDVAQEKGLPAALTEVGTQASGSILNPRNNQQTNTFGLGAMSDENWWLNAVYNPLAENNLFSGIAFIAGWANWGVDQFHVPTPFDQSAPGFITFARQPEILMLPDLNPAEAWTDYPGIGWIYTLDYPWVLHPEHGWLWMNHDFSTASRFNQWYFDLDLDWTYTTHLSYPLLHSQSYGWIYFLGRNQDGQRVFYSYDADENILIPSE